MKLNILKKEVEVRRSNEPGESGITFRAYIFGREIGIIESYEKDIISFPLEIDKAVLIKNISVDKLFRNNGIGKILIESLENEAKNKGYNALVLDAGGRSFSENPISSQEKIMFYQSCGFCLVNNNTLFMKKTL